MKIRSAAVCLLGAGAALAATALPAAAAGPGAISKCSSNHSYGYGTIVSRDSYLTKNLTCQKGFVVVNGATLDLRGHTLTGKPDPYYCVGGGCPDDGQHDQPGHAAIVLGEGQVRNGHLKGWDFGVRVFSEQHEGVKRSMTKLKVTDMAVAAMYAMDNQDTVSISRSVFKHNASGVRSILGGGLSVDRSTFTHNEGSGVDMVLGPELTVTNSVFIGNKGSGVDEYFRSGPGTFTGNTFSRNDVDGVVSSGSDGGTTVGGNVAKRNGGHGLNFPDPEVVDLGGNRASRNRTAPQCIGVVCR